MNLHNDYDRGNLYILFANILIPIGALVFLRIRAKFPTAMAALLFIFGPLIGSVTFLSVSGHLTTSWERPLVLLPFAFPLSLLFLGLWTSVCGVAGWWFFQQAALIVNMHPIWRLVAGAVLGMPIGFLLSFVFLMANSLDPAWPKSIAFGAIVADHVGFSSLASAGILAGSVCGAIIALHIDNRKIPSGEI